MSARIRLLFLVLCLVVPCTACDGAHSRTADLRDGVDGTDSTQVDTATADLGADTRLPPTDTHGGTDTGTDATAETTLSERYPGDQGLGDDPAVLLHDDFEAGWGRWDAPTSDTQYLTLRTDQGTAHAGAGFLESTVTTEDLAAQQYISSSTRFSFPRVDELYWRFYARFPEVAPNPHHWVRVAAGNETWNGSGLANTVPAGEDGFWFDFDINNNNVFNFYVYWYEMRSGRCNDGTATPGCAGDQGTTYHYGNVFRPPDQTPYPQDTWVCIEIRGKANDVGNQDGELTFWVDDQLVGDYRPGYPDGTWLRDSFHTGGCTFSACTEPVPFEGFDFRSSAEVGFKSVFLDAYYERDSSAAKRQALIDKGLTPSDRQTIYYDDVVVATQRIGCRR